jgi:rhamnose transport system permease protein
MLALCAAPAAVLGRADFGPAACLAVACLLGAALGSLNAALSIAGRLHPVIVTLGTLGIFRGAFLIATGGDWISLPPRLLALATDGSVPFTVQGAVLFALVVFAFLRWTRTGRAALKTGDDPRAARAHGIRVGRTRVATFALLGASVGLAAVFYTARFGKVQNNTGEGFELQVIAAAVLGGAHVAGGRGTVPGAFLGAALISVLSDARAVWGIHERWQLVLVGGLMLGAVGIERLAALATRRRP